VFYKDTTPTAIMSAGVGILFISPNPLSLSIALAAIMINAMATP
jgi:hypothetical protein